MAEMREAAPQTITFKETGLPPKKTTLKGMFNYAKKTGKASLLPLIAAGAITACGGGKERVNIPPTHNAGTPGVDVIRTTPPTPVETTVADFLTATAKASKTTTAETTPTETNYIDQLNSIRNKVDSDTSSAPEQKTQIVEAINRYETIYKNVDKFEKAYKKELTGTKPTLLVQQKEKFGQMDLSPIWKGKYKNEEDFLKDQIFFLHDKRILEETLQKMSSNQTISSQDIENMLVQSLIDLKVSDSVYLAINTQTENAWSFDPNVSTDVKNALSGIEPIGNVHIKIAASQLGAFFTPYPPTITMGEKTPPEVVIHEAGHATDFVENPNILKNISPEKAIEIMIARNKALLETRQYDDYQKIFSDANITAIQKIKNNEPLTETELDAAISFLANRILVNPTQERGSLISESFFAPYLKSQTLDEQKMHSDLFKTNKEFMESQSQNLDQIAKESPLFKIVIAEIRQNPDLFENYYGGANQELPKGFSGRPAQKYYDTLQTEFAPAVLFTKLMQNDPELTSALSKQQRKSILANVLLQIKVLEREQIAEGFSEAARSQSFGEYAEVLQN